MKAEPKGEFEKFNALAGKIFSVPRKELEAREKEWKDQRAAQKKKKRAKS